MVIEMLKGVSFATSSTKCNYKHFQQVSTPNSQYWLNHCWVMATWTTQLYKLNPDGTWTHNAQHRRPERLWTAGRSVLFPICFTQ